MSSSDVLLGFLADTTLRGSCILLFFFLLARMVRNGSAATRSLLWQGAFISVAGLMLTISWMPKWNLGLLPSTQSPFIVPSFPTTSPTDVALPSPVPTSVSPSDFIPSLGAALAAIWVLGFLVFAVRFWCDLYWLKRIIRTARPVRDSAWESLQTRLTSQLGMKRPVRILVGDHAMSPFVFGAIRPVIVLPAAAKSWPLDRLRMVLIHEMAHIRRHDFLQLLGLQLVCAVYWFNPLIWIARKCYVRERERACDDQVVRLGAHPEDYADHLLAIIRAFKQGKATMRTALGMARQSELEGRLLCLLEKRDRTLRPTLRLKVWMLAFGGFLTLFASGVSPWPEPLPIPVSQDGSPWLEFSPKQRAELKELGANATYVQRLADAGYTQLTPQSVRYFLNYRIDPEDVIRLRHAVPPALQPVKATDRVCMAVDQQLSHGRITPIDIEGKTYYAMPSCTLELVKNPGMRFANDPVTGQRINKAEAILAKYPNGRVLYFANKENLSRFNRHQIAQDATP